MCKPNDHDAKQGEESKVESTDDLFYDAKARSCAWCYGVVDVSTTASMSCPNCPRLYCSSSCSRMDSKGGGHEFWCGKAGEKGIDFDVLPIEGKGLGLVTKRAFQRGEKILAERPIALLSEEAEKSEEKEEERGEEKQQQPEEEEESNLNIRTATMALTPLDGSLRDKLHNNRVALGTDEASSGVFLTFSRVNHACPGSANTDHYYDDQNGVQVLVANHDIAPGVEITFPYSRMGSKKERVQNLQWRGFTCDCAVCESPEWTHKLEVLQELEDVINSLGNNQGGKITAAHVDHAIQSAYDMLDLMDELRLSDRDYARIHYDLFQLLVLRPSTLPKAMVHIQQAAQHALHFCGYDEHGTVQQFLYYRDQPQKHGNYLAAAGMEAATKAAACQPSRAAASELQQRRIREYLSEEEFCPSEFTRDRTDSTG